MDSLMKFLDCGGGRKIDTFLLCGDYGDPIYYPQLLDFIRKFRDSKKFYITTNGSYKNANFWQELRGLLTADDKIIFSIDGLEDTNHNYRVNSDWASIMTGLDIMATGPAPVIWKTLLFNYTHNVLDEIKAFAENKGAEFVTQPTHRFDNCEHLTPSHDAMETYYEYKVSFSSPDTVIINPGCLKEKIITCDGVFYPCDFIRNPKTLYKSQLWKQKSRWIDKLKIENISYDQGIEVIQDWANFVKMNSINNTNLVDVICKMKCREGL